MTHPGGGGWGGRRGVGAANVLIRARGDCEQTGLNLPPVLVFTSSHIFSFCLSFAYLQAGCETLYGFIIDRDDPNKTFVIYNRFLEMLGEVGLNISVCSVLFEVTHLFILSF